MQFLLTLSSILEASPFGGVAVVDWGQRRVVDHFQYRHAVYPASNKGIAGACWLGDRLLAVTEAELLELAVRPLRLLSARTWPYLNDCHHVAAGAGGVWICNTGLDCVEEYDTDLNWRQTHFLSEKFGTRPRELLALARLDFRKSYGRLRGWVYSYPHRTHRPAFRNVVKLLRPRAFRHGGADVRYYDMRPHITHPNHAVAVGDDIWITLWATGELVSLKTGRRLATGLAWPHDGLIVGDRFYVTDCRYSRLMEYEFDAATTTLGPRIREVQLAPSPLEGFIRGLAAIDDELLVGFTVNRGAKQPEHRRLRIRRLDRRTWATREEWSLPAELGLGVYSILPFDK